MAREVQERRRYSSECLCFETNRQSGGGGGKVETIGGGETTMVPTVEWISHLDRDGGGREKVGETPGDSRLRASEDAQKGVFPSVLLQSVAEAHEQPRMGKFG